MPDDIDVGWAVAIIVVFIAFGWFVIIMSIGQALVDWMMGWLKKEKNDDSTHD